MPDPKLRMTAKSHGVLGPTVGVCGSLAAVEAIKIICYNDDETLLTQKCLCNKMIFGNLLDGI